MLLLTADSLIDPDLETTFYFHRKLKYWTIVHHHDFYECFLVKEGSVYHIVNGERQLLREGALVFVRPHDVHSYERYEEEEVELLNINFRSRLIDHALDYLGAGFGKERLLSPALPPACTVSAEEAAWLMQQNERIQSANPGKKAEVRSLARGFLIELLTRYFGPVSSPGHPDAPAWLNELLDQMRRKINFVEGVSACYRLAPYSMEHVCREMKKHLGVTPTEWVNEQRMVHAAYLLKHSEADILDISMDCGYSSLSYFYKMFLRRFAATPAQYRKNNRKSAIPVM